MEENENNSEIKVRRKMNLEELKRLALAAKPIYPIETNDTEFVRDENHAYSEFICPMCESAGTVEEVVEWMSRDRAVGFQVFGIGEPIRDLEDYISAASPETILSLISDLETCIKALEFYNHEGWHGPAREALSKIKVGE